jgi:hypothetical protein
MWMVDGQILLQILACGSDEFNVDVVAILSRDGALKPFILRLAENLHNISDRVAAGGHRCR